MPKRMGVRNGMGVQNGMGVSGGTGRPGWPGRSAWIPRVVKVALVGLMVGASADRAGAQESEVIPLTADRFDLPDFTGYEVEYGSAFGRFFNQVRPFELNGVRKVSVLNIIDMPTGVIVDSKVIDGATLRLEHMASPFFAWAQEYAVGSANADGFEWIRIPIEGGEPLRSTGVASHGGVVDDLGFSPTLASLMPQPLGSSFRLPALQARRDGTMGETLLEYRVLRRERLWLDSGVTCECWVLEQEDSAGGIHHFWISREAPFLIKRHRDVGGERDFVSEVISFRRY